MAFQHMRADIPAGTPPLSIPHQLRPPA